MIDEVHDYSRVDQFLAARRRAMVLHSLWRPLLAGAVASLAVSAAIWVVLPKFSVREVVVDHVVPHGVPVDHVIPHDVLIEIPKIVRPEPERRPLADFPDRALAGVIVSTDADQVCIKPPNGGAPGCVSPALVDANGKAILDAHGEVQRDPTREYGEMQESIGHEAYTANSPADPTHLARYWWKQGDELIAFNVRPARHANTQARPTSGARITPIAAKPGRPT